MEQAVFADIIIDRVGTDDRVARITLNKPEVMNAISPNTVNELDRALRMLEADQSVRVIILRGAGRCFSAGWDLGASDLHTGTRYGDANYTVKDERGREYAFNFAMALRQGAEVQLKLWDVAKVTIVQAHGYVLAGGMEFAMMGDLITASTTCRFGHPAHRGVGVGRNGMILPLVIGMRKAKELFFTGDTIDGIEAESLGLINYAWPEDELEERTIALADRIANISADFLGVLKLGINSFYEQMGIRQAIQQVTLLDSMAQHTEANFKWWEDFETHGLREAVARRDGPYANKEFTKK